MTLTDQSQTSVPNRLRASVFLPAVGMIAATASQIDATIITGTYRAESPAPPDSLNFPWYGQLAGPISTWWSFSGLFLALGFVVFARSATLRDHRVGRVGAWLAVAGAGIVVIANFLSAANADALADQGIGRVIVAMFTTATALLALGLSIAGVAILRSGTWRGVWRVIPLVNGVWSFLMVPLLMIDQVQVAVGVMAALQVALGAALIAEEA